MSLMLPPVDAPVLVAAVDALPARLRKKLDDAAARLGDREVAVDGLRYTVGIDDTTVVTLTVEGGAVRSPDAVTCTCLLAPNCLHRAAVLSLAPIWDAGSTAPDAPPTDPGQEVGASGAEPETADDGAADTASRTGGDEPGAGLSVVQVAAVEQVWRAAVAVLAAGVTGSGTVARAALLRAAHEAQACKVYRPAAAARVVASLLQAARTGDPHYRLADLTEALRELLEVTHRLRTAGDAGLLGTARRQYHVEGSLRLYGLCATAVLAGTGHAGVVTYAADRRGRLWMVADVMPGDARRAARAGDATVAMGETALSHRALTRAGLVVSGATASDNGQLGAGRAVRAVTASGAAWHEEPLAGLWAEPVAEQVHRAFAALAVPPNDRPAGADLLFLRATLLGTDGDAVFAETADGLRLTLRVAADHPALGYRENLRVLGRAAGLDLLLIARPDPGRPGTVLPLAVAPPDGQGWHLPAPHTGHADLAFDRLHRSHLPQPPPTATTEPARTTDEAARGAGPDGAGPDGAGPDGAGPDGAALGKDADEGGSGAGPDATVSDGEAGGGAEDGGWRPAVHDPALQRLAAQVERTVSGGRVMLTFPSGRGLCDADRLRRARLDTGAALLDHLTGAAANRPRDAFGRIGEDDGAAFARAWLAAATYANAASRALAEASWLPPGPPN